MSQTFFLHRPEVANAFDLETARFLKKSLHQAVKNGEKSFIIASKLKKVFCAGGDLKFYSKLTKKAQGVLVNREIRGILEEFRTLPIFIIAAVEGDAVGGGCELALACDLIFASETARFAFRQIGQNLTPGWGGAKRLLQRVGPGLFLDWLSSGRWISAMEAADSGLIDKIWEEGKVLKEINSFLKMRNPSPTLILSLKKMAANNAVRERQIFEKLWWSKPHLCALAKVLKK